MYLFNLLLLNSQNFFFCKSKIKFAFQSFKYFVKAAKPKTKAKQLFKLF